MKQVVIEEDTQLQCHTSKNMSHIHENTYTCKEMEMKTKMARKNTTSEKKIAGHSWFQLVRACCLFLCKPCVKY